MVSRCACAGKIAFQATCEYLVNIVNFIPVNGVEKLFIYTSMGKLTKLENILVKNRLNLLGLKII